MKFSSKKNAIYSCGDKVTKDKVEGECCVCHELTVWVSDFFLDYYCSDECLQQEINESTGTDVKWGDIFKL